MKYHDLEPKRVALEGLSWAWEKLEEPGKGDGRANTVRRAIVSHGAHGEAGWALNPRRVCMDPTGVKSQLPENKADSRGKPAQSPAE